MNGMQNPGGAENTETTEGDILSIGSFDQYRTVDELVRRSQANSVYYTLLFLSSFIITAGILLGNSAIVIGGMLLTPVLTPVLFIALGITVGEIGKTRGAFVLVLKSVFIIVLSGAVLALVFGRPEGTFIFSNSVKTAALYFFVALASGVAGTFAWARKDILDIMPGVAIAVSLVPPLSLVGIGVSTLDAELARFNFLIFIFNLLGIIAGSLVVFSLLQFYKARSVVEREVAEVEEKNRIRNNSTER